MKHPLLLGFNPNLPWYKRSGNWFVIAIVIFGFILYFCSSKLNAKTITIDTPYLLGDYVEFAANPAIHISAGEGVIVFICIDTNHLFYTVITKDGVEAGVTVEMIEARKQKL